MVIRPSLDCSGLVWMNRATTSLVPAGMSMWKAFTSTGSRFQRSNWPLAVKVTSTSSAKGPRGPWFPGSHCGNNRVRRWVSGATGTVWVTR